MDRREPLDTSFIVVMVIVMALVLAVSYVTFSGRDANPVKTFPRMSGGSLSAPGTHLYDREWK